MLLNYEINRFTLPWWVALADKIDSKIDEYSAQTCQHYKLKRYVILLEYVNERIITSYKRQL